MLLAFRGDELTAQFWSRKFFLFDEEHVKTVAREMYGRTTSGWSSARDDYVEVVHTLIRLHGMYRIIM